MTRAEKEAARLEKLIQNEKPLWEAGQTLIAGADEVGRGPLAGPVLAACVVMPQKPLLAAVYDSKRIAEGKRQRVSQEILDIALAVGFGQAESSEIDEIGIEAATKAAFMRSVDEVIRQLGRQPDHLFTDFVHLDVSCPITPMVRADQHVYNVAAASVVAKVRRDALMVEYSEKYPAYNFAKNKGYGTAEHRRALIAEGPSEIHRHSFLGNLPAWQNRLER